jgi:alkylhydroperoxidase family enzyme
VASRAAGCTYCQAHTGHTAHRNGVDEEKLQAAFDYETSPLFDAKEHAALRLAHHAALVPNAAEDAHFDELRKHFDEEEIVDIVSVIALFGYLNRWNDTMATTLEQSPLAFGEQTLAAGGWQAGKHGEA